MRTNGRPPELFANVRTFVAFVACTRTENWVRFRTIRRALQGRSEPGRGSRRVVSDLRRGPTRPKTAAIADMAARVRERARSSPRNPSPSSRRDKRGCLVSQSLEGHIHIHTPPRQKPAPRMSSPRSRGPEHRIYWYFPLRSRSTREIAAGKFTPERKGKSVSFTGRQRQWGEARGQVDSKLQPSIDHVSIPLCSAPPSSFSFKLNLFIYASVKLQDIKCIVSLSESVHCLVRHSHPLSV